MARAECSEKTLRVIWAQAFKNQLANHLDERGMRADRRSANHVQSNLFRERACFRVQIVNHFHVV